MLPKTAKERKDLPIATGVLDYFPNALAAIAAVSQAGNAQHNPGQPLHWDKSKSSDHADSLLRHLIERGTLDTDGMRHSAKVAWRALALLEMEIENEVSLQKSLSGTGSTTQGAGVILEGYGKSITGNPINIYPIGSGKELFSK